MCPGRPCPPLPAPAFARSLCLTALSSLFFAVSNAREARQAREGGQSLAREAIGLDAPEMLLVAGQGGTLPQSW